MHKAIIYCRHKSVPAELITMQNTAYSHKQVFNIEKCLTQKLFVLMN